MSIFDDDFFATYSKSSVCWCFMTLSHLIDIASASINTNSFLYHPCITINQLWRISIFLLQYFKFNAFMLLTRTYRIIQFQLHVPITFQSFLPLPFFSNIRPFCNDYRKKVETSSTISSISSYIVGSFSFCGDKNHHISIEYCWK